MQGLITWTASATLFTGHLWSGNSYNCSWQVCSGTISTRTEKTSSRKKGDCYATLYEMGSFIAKIFSYPLLERRHWFIKRTLPQVYQMKEESSMWKYLAEGNRGMKQIRTLSRKPCIIYTRRGITNLNFINSA